MMAIYRNAQRQTEISRTFRTLLSLNEGIREVEVICSESSKTNLRLLKEDLFIIRSEEFSEVAGLRPEH